MKIIKRVKVKKAGIRPIEAHVKNVESVEAYPKKTTSVRTELNDGSYMVTYYYRRGPYGELIAEDIDMATHFERAIYDRMNHLLGTTTGELTDKIRW